MNASTEEIELVTQETLDELFSECLLPFALTAHKVNADGLGEYVVAFHDARIHSVRFSLTPGDSIRDVVRSAVLERAGRMSGPLKDWKSPNLNLE